MKIIERHISPDEKLALVVGAGEDGALVIGFEGGTWHTHPDCISFWLEVPEENAISVFVSRLLSDKLPVIISIDGGQTIDPWVSDNLPATLSMYEPSECILRLWSGVAYER